MGDREKDAGRLRPFPMVVEVTGKLVSVLQRAHNGDVTIECEGPVLGRDDGLIGAVCNYEDSRRWFRHSGSRVKATILAVEEGGLLQLVSMALVVTPEAAEDAYRLLKADVRRLAEEEPEDYNSKIEFCQAQADALWEFMSTEQRAQADRDRARDEGLMMRTGAWVGIELTRSDGSTMLHGRWKVPHDTERQQLDELGESLGQAILFEMARQSPLEVIGCRVIPLDELLRGSDDG